MVTTPKKFTTNEEKLRHLQQVLGDMLAEALKRGFFGTIGIEISIQDGTIQHLRRRLEQMEK